MRQPSFDGRKSGFSLVEIIVAVSIVAALSIVAYVAASSFTESRNNSKRIADVHALIGAVDTMVLETKSVPEPTANRSFYAADGSYSHSSSGAYGVSSSFSEDILGKYALADHPKDPVTGGFYSYGRNYDAKPAYDVAAVVSVDGTNTAYVRGTSDASKLPSLIKAYDQTSFVEDGKSSALPYNPYAKELIGRIVESTGSVTITPTKDLLASLIAGDEIKVAAGGLAKIKISDGSELTLGNSTSDSVLKISELKMKDDSGLFTRVRVALSSGEVWTKAPKLRDTDGDRSDFEVETRGAVAAVRGTVFGVSDMGTDPVVTLYEGKIALSDSGSSDPISVTGTGSTGSGIIEVAEGSTPVSVSVSGTSGTSTNVDSTTLQKINELLSSTDDSLLSTPPKLTGYSLTGTTQLTLYFESGADLLRADLNGTYAGDYPHATITGMTGATLSLPDTPIGKTLYIELCKNTPFGLKCTQPYLLNVTTANGTLVSLADLGTSSATQSGTLDQQTCMDPPQFNGDLSLIADANFDHDLKLLLRDCHSIDAQASQLWGMGILPGTNPYIPWVDTTYTFRPSPYCAGSNIAAECGATLWLQPALGGYVEQFDQRNSLIQQNFGASLNPQNPSWMKFGIGHFHTETSDFTGVFMSDFSTGASLGYQGLGNVISTSSGVVMEFGIRGASLKNPTTVSKYLMYGSLGYYLKTYNGNLVFKDGGMGIISLPYPQWLDSNKVYIVRISYLPGAAAPGYGSKRLEVFDPEIPTPVASAHASTDPSTNLASTIPPTLSIGRSAAGEFWNDPIDFFRLRHP